MKAPGLFIGLGGAALLWLLFACTGGVVVLFGKDMLGCIAELRKGLLLFWLELGLVLWLAVGEFAIGVPLPNGILPNPILGGPLLLGLLLFGGFDRFILFIGLLFKMLFGLEFGWELVLLVLVLELGLGLVLVLVLGLVFPPGRGAAGRLGLYTIPRVLEDVLGIGVGSSRVALLIFLVIVFPLSSSSSLSSSY